MENNKLMDILNKLKGKVFYKIDKKSGNRRVGKIKIMFVLIVVYFALYFALVTINGMFYPTTYATLDEREIFIGNSTNYTLNGTTDPEAAVELTADEINFNKKLTADQGGRFKQELKIPASVKEVTIEVWVKAPNKESNIYYVKLTRTNSNNETESKEPSTDISKVNESTSDTLTTIVPLEFYTLQEGEPAKDSGFFASIHGIDGKVYYLYYADILLLYDYNGDNTVSKPFKAKVSTGTVGLNSNASIVNDVFDMKGKQLS